MPERGTLNFRVCMALQHCGLMASGANDVNIVLLLVTRCDLKEITTRLVHW